MRTDSALCRFCLKQKIATLVKQVEETGKMCGILATENERLRLTVNRLIPLLDADRYEYGRKIALVALGEDAV
jgi:regulator of replication initiation timing